MAAVTVLAVLSLAPPVDAFIETVNPPQAIAVNPETGRMYLANYNHSISVIDTETDKIIAHIDLVDHTQDDYFEVSIALNEITNKVYVGSAIFQKMYVIDGNADRIVKEIPLDQHMNVMSIAVNPASNRIYGASATNILYVIDGSTDEIVEKIDIGNHGFMAGHEGWDWPAELSVNPNTNLVYATNTGHDLISVINGSNNRIIANITVDSPYSAVINPSTDKLYVTYGHNNSIAVFDGSDPYDMLYIIPDVVSDSFNNQQVAVDPARSVIYVASYPSGITAIDGISDTRIKTIPSDFPPVAIGVNPKTGKGYVGMDGWNMIAEFGGDEDEEDDNPVRTVDVLIGNQTYQFFYMLSSGRSLDDITVDKELLSIRMDITVPTKGRLELIFPRETYDILTFTEHEPMVFADDVPADSLEVRTTCEQVSIGVLFEAGTESLDLVYGDILGAHSHSYPAKISLVRMVGEQGQNFAIGLTTDAKKCDVSFLKEQKKIHIDIEGREEANEGYFSLRIPHDLLGGNYTILVDGQRIGNFTEEVFYTTSNEELGVIAAFPDENTPYKASQITFSYPKDATTIDIIGTTAIPEFGSSVHPVVIAASIGAILILSRQRHFGLQK
jgi:YVTN family beta-propeller protein